ncbi:MAG: hypothetical protein K2X38_14390 [Gemmataceae bacterium]|nr:hypothetical protein [Gemmataceae bacterium]
MNKKFDDRILGWLFIVLGIVAFFGGLYSASGLRGQAILAVPLVGLLLAGRGAMILYNYVPLRPELDPSNNSHGALALYANEIGEGLQPAEVKCETCGTEYVYMPLKATQAQADIIGEEMAAKETWWAFNRYMALAPCPECSRLPQEMFLMARSRLTRLFINLGAIFALGALGAVMALVGSLVNDNAPAGLFAASVAGLSVCVLLSGGLFFWDYRRKSSYDFNRAEDKPYWTRIAKKVSLPKSVYLSLAGAKTADPVSSADVDAIKQTGLPAR